MNLNKNKLKKIKGDASYRHFFRKKNDNENTIIVHAKKEKEKNLLIYDCINNLLIKNNILAPRLYSEKYNKGYIEIEDFGDETIFSLLKKKKINKIKIFKDIILLLIDIQKIKKRNIKTFKKKIYKIPIYTNKSLFKEAELFCDWYVSKTIPKVEAKFINTKMKKLIKILLSKIKLGNNIFVHRDFHVSNLMKHKERIGVIDTQDALIGNRAYDLASLIDDVRFNTEKNFKNQIFEYYIKKNKEEFNRAAFVNDFKILSVLRNLKIIGIFTRLAIRDKKPKYLKLIPEAWKLIEIRISSEPLFKDLKYLLDKNFSKKIRSKNAN